MSQRYIRFKPIPADGHSVNASNDQKEAGLSCYEAQEVKDRKGKVAWRPAGESWERTKAAKKTAGNWLRMIHSCDLVLRNTKKTDVAFLLSGEVLAKRGSSGEPLLANYVVLAELVCSEDDEELLVEKGV